MLLCTVATALMLNQNNIFFLYRTHNCCDAARCLLPFNSSWCDVVHRDILIIFFLFFFCFIAPFRLFLCLYLSLGVYVFVYVFNRCHRKWWNYIEGETYTQRNQKQAKEEEVEVEMCCMAGMGRESENKSLIDISHNGPVWKMAKAFRLYVSRTKTGSSRTQFIIYHCATAAVVSTTTTTEEKKLYLFYAGWNQCVLHLPI